MNKIYYLDLGTNSIGLAIVNDKVADNRARVSPTAQQSFQDNNRRLRIARRKEIFFGNSNYFSHFLKRNVTLFIQILLVVLLATFLFMTLFRIKDYQYWLNLSVTVLLGWIAIKNKRFK